jgi:hypothetical protein
MTGQTAKVVALVGVPGSGKSIVARRLLERGYAQLRFADPVRDMLKAAFGLTDEDLEGPGRKRTYHRFGGRSPENLSWLLVDTWGRREVHSDLWVNEWRRRLHGMTGFVLTDDLQRMNEAAAVHDFGGLVVRVTRPDYRPSNPRALDWVAHVPHDVELMNNGPDSLAAAADELGESLGRGLIGGDA